MKLRFFHIWWLGIILFGASLLIWLISFAFFAWRGELIFTFEDHSIRYLYLPFTAALLGLGIPIVCMRYLRASRPRVWVSIFIIYTTAMLTWGIIDIRYENYQAGFHHYCTGNGYTSYYHQYYTWYFLPDRWIEKGID